MHTPADPATAAAPADSGIALHTFGQRDRPPLLLIHGIGMGHRLWLRQIDEFSATHFVIAPDLAGLTSPARDVPIDIALVAQSLARALRSLGVVELSVCAISAGASVALGLALLGNVLIRRLMLSAPQARAPRIALGLQIAICAAIPESALVKAAVKEIGGGPDIAAAAAEDYRALGKRGLLGAMAALWRLDLRQRLREIDIQTWVFCGSNDRVNLPAARAIAAAMSRSVLRVENGMGHLWNVQDPARFNRAVREAMSGDYPNNAAG